MSTLDNLRATRLEKLKKIKALGINPYPARCQKEQTTGLALKMMGQKVSVAGRIMAVRGHGGIQFFDLRDESGKIQLVFKSDKLQKEKIVLLELLDIGDFIDTQGEVFKTQAGEISVLVSDFHLLTKSIRPLPSSWYGLKDIEEKYRKRYLDLIISPQSKKNFEIRSKIIGAMREFLVNRGYYEVETPVLQVLYGGGLARPFKTYHNVLGIPLYMRISTELYLKRLIVGGFEKVFEFARLFRNEGIDKNHNPEFTMLETMEAYIDYKENMKLVEEMTEYAVKKAIGKTKVNYEGNGIYFKAPWKRITMNEAVKQVTGIDFMGMKSLDEALEAAEKIGLRLEEYHKQATGLILSAAFEEKVEETLIQPTFIYDFPVETSPLAKRCENDPRFVERFEHFIAGVEMSNNYSELNDPLELGIRFQDERKKEKLGDEEAHQTDEDFIEAMEYGMPPTSGIGPGIDRLVLVVCGELGAQNLRDVILFPTMKPKAGFKDNGLRGDRETRIPLKKALPDDIRVIFEIGKDVREKFPGMKVGVALIENAKVHQRNKDLEKLKKETLKEFSRMQMTDIDEIPSIKAYRNIFKAFGVDWHSRRPSADALLRRVVQGKGLYNVNTLVDAYNVAVLESKIALGAFDLDKLILPVTLKLAREDEEITLLGELEPTRIKEKEMVYADQRRIMTLDLNYRDCDYTKITAETKNVILFADGYQGISSGEVMAGLEKGIEYITKFCGGKLVKKFIVE